MSAFRKIYEREVAARLANGPTPAVVTEPDLAPLPPPVATWLRRAGVVGRPRVSDYRVRWKGALRQGPDKPWMSFVADQHNFTDPPARYFLMKAHLFGVPFESFHRFADGTATMQVRAAALFSVADAKGPKMDQSETVTLFNDMCLVAPATLLDPRATWESVDPTHARGTFTLGAHRIGADLTFNADGDLVDFVSRDRFQSADGHEYRAYPWATPVRAWADLGNGRIASFGEARWVEPRGDWVYGTFHAVEHALNVGAGALRSTSSPRLDLRAS